MPLTNFEQVKTPKARSKNKKGYYLKGVAECRSPNSNLRNDIPKINADFKVNEQNLHEKLAYFKVPLLNMLTDAKEHITGSSNAGDMPLGTTPDHYLHNHAYILVTRSCSVVRQTPKLFCRRCLMRICQRTHVHVKIQQEENNQKTHGCWSRWNHLARLLQVSHTQKLRTEYGKST